MTRIAESRDGYSDLGWLWAMPCRPALVMNGAEFHRLRLSVTIAIASVALCIFCIVYFGGQLLRGAF